MLPLWILGFDGWAILNANVPGFKDIYLSMIALLEKKGQYLLSVM